MTFHAKFAAIGLAGLLAVGVAGTTFAFDGPGAGLVDRLHHRHPFAVAFGAREVVEASGLDASLFREGAQNGESMNDVLAANGLDPAAVLATALEDIDAQLDAKVADGSLTQEQADAAYTRAETGLPKIMEATPEPGHHPVRNLVLGVLRSAAESIGIAPRDLAGELRGGATIADVATEHGVDPQQVIDDMTADANARIDEALANGRITEDQAARLRERAATAIPRLVNEVHRPANP